MLHHNDADGEEIGGDDGGEFQLFDDPPVELENPEEAANAVLIADPVEIERNATNSEASPEEEKTNPELNVEYLAEEFQINFLDNEVKEEPVNVETVRESLDVTNDSDCEVTAMYTVCYEPSA